MWFWIITFMTAGGLTYQIISKYRFARMRDAQQHMADQVDEIEQIMYEQDGIGMTEVEVRWEPRQQDPERRN